MVEHLRKVVLVNHTVHTTNHPRRAVDIRGLVRLILLPIRLRNRNPADHFGRIRCLSCWVDHGQLQTETHQTREPSLNIVKTQVPQLNNMLTKIP